MNALNKTAFFSAVLYLIITVLAPFSMSFVPSALILPGDAEATVNQVVHSEGLFRAGIASDAVVFLAEIALTAALYALLKPVSKTLSLTAAFSRLAMTIVQGINLLPYFFVLLLLSGAGYSQPIGSDQLYVLVMLFLNAHEYVALIWGLFFGLHLIILGYLVYKSGYLPRFVGIILVATAFIYLANGFGTILFPSSKPILDSIAILAFIETVFPLWLLIKGVNFEQRQRQVLESA
jgi:hypothetical protein